MFGLGKLISGLTGGLLDRIGLGFLSPFISGAVNFFSGNYLALIGDITSLVSRFGSSSFLQNLSLLNPLGGFSQGSSCFGNLLAGDRFNTFQSTARLLGLDKADKMFNLIGDFKFSTTLIRQNRENAHYGFLR